MTSPLSGSVSSVLEPKFERECSHEKELVSWRLVHHNTCVENTKIRLEPLKLAICLSHVRSVRRNTEFCPLDARGKTSSFIFVCTDFPLYTEIEEVKFFVFVSELYLQWA